MIRQGFDNALFIQKQTQHITERIAQWGGKLYLEFGGKLFDDYHAARVLPGYDANGKINLLHEMREQTEIIFAVSADDIEKTKVRADLGISYDMEVLRLIDDITQMGIAVNSVVITKYTGQTAADGFAQKLTTRGVKNYIHRPIKGYPTDIDYICSDEGYGANPVYRDDKAPCGGDGAGPRLRQAGHLPEPGVPRDPHGPPRGYAKFETFPVWNLPLKHPVNLAYEAATADLADVNMIDPFHLEAYGETTVNYNRDVEAFPPLCATSSRAFQAKNAPIYRSPTDMGVNMVGYAITDDEAVKHASGQEIIRRYFKALCDHKQGARGKADAVDKIKRIMQEMGLSTQDRPVVAPGAGKAEGRGHIRHGYRAAGRPDHHRQGQQPDERLVLLRAERHQRRWLA